MTEPTTRKGGRPVGSKNSSVVFDSPQFEEPPSQAVQRAQSSSVWTKQAEGLRARPGQWARVSTHTKENSAKQTASGLRNGTRKGFSPKGSFEARFGEAGNSEDGKIQYGVWARYVGDPSSN